MQRTQYRLMLTTAAVFAAVVAAVVATPPASAQTITGVVVEHGTERPIAGVQLLLLDDRGDTRDEAISSDSGAFVLAAPEPGSFLVTAEMIGFASMRSEPLELDPGEEVAVEVRMAIEAVPLEPLVVQGRKQTMGHQLSGFHSRMARGRKSGFGHFISREDVDRFNPLESTDLLRMAPGVRVVSGRTGRGAGLRMSGGCIPAIYVDGMQVNRPPMRGVSLDEIVPAMALEGIEVYRGASAQQGSYYDPTGCGLVLVWTRRGTNTGQPWSWTKFFVASGLLAAIVLLVR